MAELQGQSNLSPDRDTGARPDVRQFIFEELSLYFSQILCVLLRENIPRATGYIVKFDLSPSILVVI